MKRLILIYSIFLLFGLSSVLFAHPSNNTDLLQGGVDIGICNIESPVSDYCGFDQLQPAVWVKNYSDFAIEYFVVSYRLDFYQIVYQDITETIDAGDSILVSFDAVNINSGNHSIQFTCSITGAISDINSSNNSAGLSFSYSMGKQVQISVNTDNYGYETSWIIKNSQDQIIAEGDNLESNTLYQETLCLITDCYSFVIYDSFGDGICSGYGDGYYLIENITDDIEIGTGCNFTASETVNFCIETEPGLPIANISRSSIDNCEGKVSFYDMSVCVPEATSWLWQFGDDSVSEEQNPEHSYLLNGHYDVSLTVTNANGSSTITIPNFVQINKASPPFIQDEHFCFGNDVSFFASSDFGTVNWYLKQNDPEPVQIGLNYSFSNLLNDTVVYYEVILGHESMYFGMQDNSGVGGYFNFAIDRIIYFNALTDVTIKSAVVFASGSSERTITLKDTEGSILDERIINIPEGESRIDLNFQVPQGEDYEIHVNQANNLSYTGDYSGPDVGYPFTVPDLISITGNNYSNSFWYFFYDIEVYEGFENMCLSERTPLNAIMSSQNVSLGNDTLVCFGNPFPLSPGTNYIHYLWSTEETDSEIFVTEDGNYSVTTTDEYSCTADGSVNIEFSDELIFNEVVHHPTTADSFDGSIVIEIVSGNTPCEILWDNSQTEFSISDLTDGIYSYTITDSGDCQYSGSITLSNLGNIYDKNDLNQYVYFYPNPANEQICIESKDFIVTSVCIYDLNGKILSIIEPDSKEININISDLANGEYIVEITTKNGMFCKKLLKK